MPDHVAEYFGAHVASYFHFYNTMTRWEIAGARFWGDLSEEPEIGIFNVDTN